MKIRKKSLPSLALAALLALSLAACGAPEAEEPAERAGIPEAGEGTALTNGGLTLNIPAEYAGLLIARAPEDDGNGVLFTVSEKASVEAGEKQHPGEEAGDGWLFDIQRVSEEDLRELLCNDMSGMEVFAKDGTGAYLFCSPTDVRLVRDVEDYSRIPEADLAQWTALNEWARTVKTSFLSDNPGLAPFTRTNTDVDVLLARAAYLDEPVILTCPSRGTLSPESADGAAYLEELLDGMTVDRANGAGAPDGEYVSLEFPETGQRLDFFPGGGGFVRAVNGEGEFEDLYRVTVPEGSPAPADVILGWYNDLAAAREAA